MDDHSLDERLERIEADLRELRGLIDEAIKRLDQEAAPEAG